MHSLPSGMSGRFLAFDIQKACKLEQVWVRTFSPPVVDHRLATHMRSDVLTRTTRW